jgi:hypothetical protein
MDNRARLASCLTLSAACFCAVAHADVTVEKKTSLDASIMRMHGSTITRIAGEKKRDDTESHCEGMMSLVCGNVRSGEIVRLDRGVTWRLQPDKKSYREEQFATPEQLAEIRARMQANLEKMRSCPASPQQQQVDNSKCQMSPPKIEVHKTGDKLSIAGHDAQRTAATLTESCTNKETGDVCDTVIAYDLWLTQDKFAGAAVQRAFEQAYAKKLGLGDEGVMRGEAARFLAPYQAQIKELTDKSDDFKGQPLRTSLRVLMGGQQCSATAKMKSSGSSASSGDANPMNNVTQAGKAIGNLVGGLFKKKKTDDSQAPASSDGSAAAPSSAAAGAAAPAAAPAATAPADPYAQYVQIASFTSETVSISTDPVPADRFEIPADWNKVLSKPSSAKDNDEFTCPKTGG